MIRGDCKVGSNIKLVECEVFWVVVISGDQ